MKFYFEKYIINALREMSLSFVIMAPCYCVESDSDISSWITLKKEREKTGSRFVGRVACGFIAYKIRA